MANGSMHHSRSWRKPPPEMESFGKMLVFAGLAIAAIGGLLWSGFGRGWLGRLPGDINIERGGFGFHFPIVTCIVVSIILTIVLGLFRR